MKSGFCPGRGYYLFKHAWWEEHRRGDERGKGCTNQT